MPEERVIYDAAGRAEVRRATRLPITSEEYVAPSGDEFRTVTQLLGWTGGQTARFMGISDGRTVRKWISEESPIPYAVWRLLLIEAGIAIERDNDQQFVEPTHGEPDRDEDQIATWWNARKDQGVWSGAIVGSTWDQLWPEVHATLRSVYRSAHGGRLVSV
jgi:hypothetical protein